LLAFAVARPKVPPTDYSLHRADWLKLLLVTGVGAGLYFGLLALWKKQRTPQHEFLYRRSMLRAGLGVAAVLALALLVAWPYQRRIAAAISQPTLAQDESLPVAAVMVIDTSQSMEYKHENRTRLEVAQDIAARHIGSLPRLSRVAVCDTIGEPHIRFTPDLRGAAKRIAGLTSRPVNRPLDDRILAALEAQIDDREQTGAADRGARDADGKEGIVRE